MISVEDESKFTITIADLIKTLAKLDEFVLKIWINTSEIAFEFDESNDFQFLQESLKVITDSSIEYIFYDLISGIRIEYYDNNKGMVIGYM